MPEQTEVHEVDDFVDIEAWSDEPDITTLSVEEYLLMDGAPQRFTPHDRSFAIADDDEALWAMRRLAIAQRRMDEVKRMGQVEIDRVLRWVTANSQKYQRTIDHTEEILSEYILRIREDEQDGRKSLDFPDGKVTSRITQDKISVEDEEAFLRWADENGHTDWVRVTRKPDIKTLKTVVDHSESEVIDPMTGEIVAGLQFVDGGVEATVTVTD